MSHQPNISCAYIRGIQFQISPKLAQKPDISITSDLIMTCQIGSWQKLNENKRSQFESCFTPLWPWNHPQLTQMCVTLFFLLPCATGVIYSLNQPKRHDLPPIHRQDIPHLFELRHPVPRPNFWGGVLLKKSKDQYIIGTVDSDNSSAHKQGLDYEPMSPGH